MSDREKLEFLRDLVRARNDDYVKLREDGLTHGKSASTWGHEIESAEILGVIKGLLGE